MAFTNKMLQFFPSVFIFHRSLSKPTQGCVSVSFLFSAPTCSSAWAPSTELDLGMRWGGGGGVSLSARDAEDPRFPGDTRCVGSAVPAAVAVAQVVSRQGSTSLDAGGKVFPPQQLLGKAPPPMVAAGAPLGVAGWWEHLTMGRCYLSLQRAHVPRAASGTFAKSRGMFAGAACHER